MNELLDNRTSTATSRIDVVLSKGALTATSATATGELAATAVAVGGTLVAVRCRALLGGPIEVKLRGGLLAIRRDEAACVGVVTEPQ